MAVLLHAVSADAQEGPAAMNLPAATIAGEIAGDRVSDPDKQGDWPAIAYARDGSQVGGLDRMER